MLMNGASTGAGVCVCARRVTDAGGRAVIKSQPPSHLRPHQPPVALLPCTLMLTCYATRLPQAVETADVCACVCVCVLNNGRGLAQIKRSGLVAKLTTRHTNS